MPSTQLLCKVERLEASLIINLQPETWNIPERQSTSTNTFTFSDLEGTIKIYPNGNRNNTKNYLSLFIRLFPKSELENNMFYTDLGMDDYTPHDPRKVTTTITCGTLTKSFTAIASKYGKNEQNAGWGYSRFATVKFMKNNPIINIILTMNSNTNSVPTTGITKSFEAQQLEMYELSKVNGDITLIIKDKNDENDEGIHCAPPHKKRRLNTNNSNDTNGLENEYNIMKVSGIILQSASPVFKSILSTNMIEKKERKIIIEANDIKCVDNMYYFMCTNKLRKDTNGINVFKLGNYYQMERLKYECINKMIKEININNFVETIQLFDMYGIKNGYDKLIQFAKKNVEALKTVDGLSHSFKMTVLEC